MKLFEFLWVIFCIFEFCFADLDIFGCTDEIEEWIFCSTQKDAYAKPFPVVVDTTLELKSINEIDEYKNSISLQVVLACNWKDPGILISSNISK